MPISFETSRLETQWPVIQTAEASGLTKCRKRNNGWKSKEETRRQGENIDRPDTKWAFEDNLTVEIKIIEDPQAPLHVGAGRLPDWFRNKKGLALYPDDLCILTCLAVHLGAHRQYNKRQTRELAAKLFRYANHPA